MKGHAYMSDPGIWIPDGMTANKENDMTKSEMRRERSRERGELLARDVFSSIIADIWTGAQSAKDQNDVRRQVTVRAIARVLLRSPLFWTAGFSTYWAQMSQSLRGQQERFEERGDRG